MAEREGKLLRLMGDHQWHSQTAMIAAAGHRFSTVVFDLRRKGFEIEKEPTGSGGWRYRLVKAPDEPAPPTNGQIGLEFGE